MAARGNGPRIHQGEGGGTDIVATRKRKAGGNS